MAVWGLFTDKGALGFFTVSWAMTFPITEWLFANGFASRSRVCALGVTCWFFADGITFWASTLLAVLHWAADFALRLVTLDGALAATQLLAASRAAWLFTDWFANLVADGGTTFPLTLWMTVLAFTTITGRVGAGNSLLNFVGEEGCRGGSHKEGQCKKLRKHD